MRVLGIDYGIKNIGFAVGDDDVTLPLKQIKNLNEKYVLKNILDIVDTENIDIIVIGLPVFHDEKQEELHISFKNRVEKEILTNKNRYNKSIKVTTVNEEYTTQKALDKYYTKRKKLKKLKKKLDSYSAEEIIKNYWESILN